MVWIHGPCPIDGRPEDIIVVDQLELRHSLGTGRVEGGMQGLKFVMASCQMPAYNNTSASS